MKKLALLASLYVMATTMSGQSSILAREYATEAAVRIMDKISPMTGDDAEGIVIEAEYDYEDSRYIIDMEARWMAQRNWLADEELFVVRGILKVGKKGEQPVFKETFRNAAVKHAWSMDKVTIYRNQLPARGVRISLEYDGLFQSGFTSQVYTNDDGVAYVEHASTGMATVYVNGQARGRMRTPGSEVYYL
jgi:hypothetical protein